MIDRSVPDELLAAAVRSALDELNAAIGRAHDAGMVVQVEVLELHEATRSDPNPSISVTVSRPV